MLRSLLTIAVLLLFVPPALGWSKAGHMVSGAIAFDVLETRDPEAAARVIALLKAHPQFEQRWAGQLANVPEEMKGKVLFMLAARWPDDIRDDPKYNQPKWHYIDFPYRPPGQPDSVQTAQPDDPNAQIAFRANIAVLQSDAADADKAIALCWIFHLVGDIHQPLHTTSLFTADFPARGDQGGTLAFVRTEQHNEPLTLHKFWDDLIITADDVSATQQRAAELQRLFPRGELSELSGSQPPTAFEEWIGESFSLAKRHVYREGTVSGSPVRENALILDEDYIAFARYVANRRLVVASYRLADVLAASVR